MAIKNSKNVNEVQGSLLHIPFFSVIIAAYNRAELIKRALDSILAQTEKDWEAIIVDDGSTDDTYSIIYPYIKTYSQIKYISKPHSGEAATKNTGIWSAKGRFISFLDSDDEYDPRHLKLRKRILQKNPELQFIYGGARILGNQFVPDRFNHGKMINLNKCVIGGTFFIDRDFLISVKGFKDISLGTDADLFDRIKAAGIMMTKIDYPTYIYHHETEDSITNRMFQNIKC